MPGCTCSSSAISPESIILRSGAQWQSYYFARDTAIYTESGKATAWGSYMEQLVEGFYPGLSAASVAAIRQLLNGHYILIIALWSGEFRVLGSLDAPMLFLPTSSSGRRRTDRAGSSWRFYGQSRYPACFATATPEDIPVGAGDYDPLDYDSLDYYTG
jgi:hypothetical protein